MIRGPEGYAAGTISPDKETKGRIDMRRAGAPIVALAFAAATFAGLGKAQAEDWPTRPVTMVVPFAAGGPVDVLGRILAHYLGEAIGKQVIVDNVPGGGGINGSLRVSQATPDGYMLVLGSIGTHALNQTLSKKPRYDAATDFSPVALIADVGLVLIARKDLPADNLAAFMTYAKTNQAKMQFGSGGAGTSSHIGCVLLNQTIGVDTQHVPYRGGGPAMADLIAGRVDYVCNIASTVGQAIEAQQVKAIAALTRERSPILPDLPTAHEQGLKDFDAYTWNAIFLPKSTPPALVKRLNDALVKVMSNAAFQERLRTLGLIVVAPERRSPDYLQKFVVDEIAKWAIPIKASGVTED
jgi:tripartite-type tricarboxylate transporter receptor subunit TctC